MPCGYWLPHPHAGRNQIHCPRYQRIHLDRRQAVSAGRTPCALPGDPPRCGRWSLPGAPDRNAASRRIHAPATFVIPFTSSNGPVTDSSNLRISHPLSGNCSRQLLLALLYLRGAEPERRIALHPCSRRHPAPVAPGAQDIVRLAGRWSALVELALEWLGN